MRIVNKGARLPPTSLSMAVGTSFTRGNPNIALIAFVQINTCSCLPPPPPELAEITKKGTCNLSHSSTFHLSGYFPVNQVKNCSPRKMMHSRIEIFFCGTWKQMKESHILVG